jgi:hypothetical protein
MAAGGIDCGVEGRHKMLPCLCTEYVGQRAVVVPLLCRIRPAGGKHRRRRLSDVRIITTRCGCRVRVEEEKLCLAARVGNLVVACMQCAKGRIY